MVHTFVCHAVTETEFEAYMTSPPAAAPPVLTFTAQHPHPQTHSPQLKLTVQANEGSPSCEWEERSTQGWSCRLHCS
eukprot:scaffold72350_cov19-Tisochrysis_lutea.AAC.1